MIISLIIPNSKSLFLLRVWTSKTGKWPPANRKFTYNDHILMACKPTFGGFRMITWFLLLIFHLQWGQHFGFQTMNFPKMYNGHLFKKRGPKRLRISLLCIFRIQVPGHEHSRHPPGLALPIQVKNAEKIEGRGFLAVPKYRLIMFIFSGTCPQLHNQRSISLATTSYTNIRHVTWGVSNWV